MRQLIVIALVVISALLSSGAAPRWEAVDAPGAFLPNSEATPNGLTLPCATVTYM